MKSELKPCPFCMGDRIHVSDGECSITGDAVVYRSHVICSDCKAMICRTHDESPDHAHRAAVESWNRRSHGGTAYMEGKNAGNA